MRSYGSVQRETEILQDKAKPMYDLNHFYHCDRCREQHELCLKEIEKLKRRNVQ